MSDVQFSGREHRGDIIRPAYISLLLLLTVTIILFLLGILLLPSQGWAEVTTATWRDFSPATWITATPFTVSVSVDDAAGLLHEPVAYRLSTDGGITWTDWLTQNVTTTQPLSTSLIITVTGLALPDAASDNLIRFQAWENTTTPVESPPFTLRVDTHVPTVTITSPTADSVAEQITISGQADDATSGVAGIAVSLQDEGGRYWNGTAWQSAPAWLSATGTLSWTYAGPVPTWQDGYYTVRARATDIAGNEATSPPVTAIVDLSPPSSPLTPTVIPVDWTNQNAFTVTWTNPPDPAGIAGVWYRIGGAPTRNDDGTFVAGNDIHQITGLSLSAEGQTPIYFWLQDSLGHTDYTTAARVTARYDATPPLPPFGLRASPSGWQRTNDFSLRWYNPPDLSGIAGVYYRFGTPPASAQDGIFVSGANITSLSHLQVPGEGKFDVYIWLVDAAGNADHTRANSLPDAFWYDATPPTVNADVTGDQGENGWYVGPVTVTLSALDALSGVADVQYQVNGAAWTGGTSLQFTRDGVYALAYRAVDVAGNWSPTQAITISIDQTPPVLTYTVSPEPAASGWYTRSVTIDVQATDEGSGLASVSYQLDGGEWITWSPGDVIRITQDGEHTLVIRARDNAGNVTSVGPLTFPVDRSAPVTAYVVEGAPGDGLWYISPVTVTLVPTDTASGVVATYYRVDGGAWQQGTQFVVDTDGKHVFEFYSVDAAGWKEEGFPTDLWVDTTAPPAPPAVWIAPSTWTNQNQFRVEWATPSDLSQVVGAYYKLDEPPTAPDDGTFVAETHAIADISVTGEGAHTLYLWLKDGAGNADHTSAAVVEGGLKYDTTPPTTSPVFNGEQGANDWWRSAVVVTFRISDTLSGPDVTHVAVDDGPWMTQQVVTISQEGKHILRFYSVDQAGNVESEQRQPVRVDMQAPPTPDDLRVVTQGWQRENRFLVRWTPPLDTSGIWGIRYTVGSPPAAPDDGTLVEGLDEAVITAPEEGKFDVYIWLVDRAGNGDPSAARYFPQALWYDATPPNLDVRVSGNTGENGWYVGPVTVRAVATDTVSGHVQVWASVDDSTPITLTTPLVLTEEGRHQVRVWATDAAGNVSPAWEQEIRIDRSPPAAWVNPLPPYMTDYRPIQGDLVLFNVAWGGTDGPHGSGIVAYDIQVRDGFSGAWLIWQNRTSETSGTFVGQIGHTYFFRIRAYDAAGHVHPFTTAPYGDTYTHLEPVRNGDFGTGNFLFWNAARVPQREPDKNGNPVGGAGLMLTVKDAEHYTGMTSLAAWLGDPEYGGAEDPGLVPIGGAVISQTITVPTLDQMPRPTLEFWYHMITWDVVYAPSHKRWQDTFELRILSPDGRELDRPLRAGYRSQHIPPIKGVDYAVKHDLGWRRFRYDLSRYAGKTITIELSTWNRWDNKYNTYTIVDDVRIVDPALTPRYYMPLLMTRGNRRHLQEDQGAPIIPVPVPAEPGTGER